MPSRQAATADSYSGTDNAQELTHGRMTEQPEVMATRPAKAALPMVIMSHTRVPVSILRRVALHSSPAAETSPCEEVRHAQQGSAVLQNTGSSSSKGGARPAVTIVQLGAHQQGLRLQVRGWWSQQH